jgi:hypothetical protein
LYLPIYALIVAGLLTTQKRKSPKDLFKRARENGSEKNKDIFSREEVKKKLRVEDDKGARSDLDNMADEQAGLRDGRLRIFYSKLTQVTDGILFPPHISNFLP